ncbi:IclR family transcriptional regulator [Halomonas sp. KAO]|uniref:IclR family transcriptional regulator n=1 Tax=unclassified Halomonas TaxID=2609666 RepID=UPI00189E70F1|nr:MULTISPECIES: IclR family transcriptional regulator [unclassified Halomonas]MBF7052883.1 IclR family transcriptional regulator [Halomonas sp. KAO]MDT0500823.1 IclR family transcriptional regulator [Halomonas sp. PAR7]MDT0512987.1 IclR family transcriptional regulator [Halomonas sp. LES1]MDT0591602.1 IclR family transcriptional regulator [Halomonas sp. PAR8]
MTSHKTETTRIEGDTPAQRLLALLEVIADKDHFFTLQSLVEETGMPKPTLHRMLQQLEGSGMLQREADSRHYGKGSRLRRLAENLLLNDTVHGARHAVLRQLVDEVGESCNITALSGSEVLYLDRVETSEALRFYLHPGSRVPVHCSASGKLFLAQMSPAQRRRLLGEVPLKAFTKNTLTDMDQLEQEIDEVRQQGYAFDDEEFLSGLLCIAVLANNPQGGKSNIGIAIQAPIMRLTRDKALECLPALQRAADAIAAIDSDAMLTQHHTASSV